jgi:plastocyanin
MNTKIIGGVVIVVVIVAGVAFVMNKNNSASTNMPMPTAMQNSKSQANPTNEQTPAGKNAVTIQNFAFSPATITVKAGDAITWTNQDSVGHSATADDNSFDTGVLSQGQSKAITFSKPGTYSYHCSVHPNMKGTVVVK